MKNFCPKQRDCDCATLAGTIRDQDQPLLYISLPKALRGLPLFGPTGAPRCFLGNPDTTIPVAKTLPEYALCEGK